MAALEGYLYKMNPRKKLGRPVWKRRYFKLEEEKLYYFVGEADSKHLDYIPVHQIVEVHTELFTSVPEQRHLNCGFCVATHPKGRFKGRKFNLLAQTADDRDKWVRDLGLEVQQHRADEETAQTFEGDDVSLSELVDDGDDEGATPSTFTLEEDGDSSEDADEFENNDSGYINFIRKRGGDGRKKNGSKRRSMRKTKKAEPEPWTVVGANLAAAAQNQNEEEGIGMRKRSAAVSRGSVSTAQPMPKPRPAAEAGSSSSSPATTTPSTRTESSASVSGFGAGAVKIWLDEGEGGQHAFGVSLSAGATVADLQAKIATTLGSEDVVELWEVSAAGVDRMLGPERDPFEVKRLGGRIYLLSPDRRILVVFFEDGSFVPAVVPFKLTSRKLLASENPDVRDKVLDLSDPGVFLRRNGIDQLFHEDDRPLDVFYDEGPRGQRARREADDSFSLGKLVIKSKSLRQRTESSARLSVSDYSGATFGKPARKAAAAAPVTREPQTAAAVTSAAGLDADGNLRSFLFKKGAYNAAWKKRWCTLQDGLLRYYRHVADREPAGTLLVKDIADVCENQAESSKDSRYAHCFEVGTTNGRDYMFCAESRPLMHQWIRVIEKDVTNADKVGHLYKKGFNNQAWKRRWFVLRGSELAYYEAQGDKSRRGIIDLQAASHIGESGLDNGISIISGDRVYYLRASNLQDRNDWLRALKGTDTRLVPEPIGHISMPSPVSKLTPSTAQLSASAFDEDDDVDDPSYLTRPARSGGIARGQRGGKRAGLRSFRDQAAHDEDIPSSDFTEPIQPPAPLPKAEISVEESRSSDFGSAEYQGRDWSAKRDPVALSPGLQSVMASHEDSLGTLFASRPRLLSEAKPHDMAPLENKVKQIGSAPAPEDAPQEMTDDDLERLGLSFQNALNPEVEQEDGATMQVATPAMLKLLVRSLVQQSEEDKVTRISLGGVVLIHAKGQWRKDTACEWHDLSAMEAGGRMEKFTFGPQVVAMFSHKSKQWCVLSRATLVGPNESAGSRVPPAAEEMDAEAEANGTGSGYGQHIPRPRPAQDPQSNPVVRAWVKRGGLKFVTGLHRAVEELIAYYSAVHGKSANSDRFNLLDDSKNETIGILVRKSLCSAVAQILVHGLLPTRSFGLIKNTVWSLVMASCPKPTAQSTATAIVAYRVVRDLESNRMMKGDDHMKFRSFVCASLNHKFLEYWLADVYENETLLGKFHNPGAFLRTCPRSVFEDLLLGLNPLMVLNFRLFSSFEIQRRMSVNRDWSVAQQRPRSEAAAPTAITARPRVEKKRVVALYDVDDPDEDELAFAEGDVLTVESRVDTEWYLCALNGHTGLVPINFVEDVEP